MKKTVLLDVYGGDVKVMQIKGELEEFYENIGCGCIDITSRKIGGKWYDIVVDDEGLFKESFKISAMDSNMKPVLVGNLMFFNIGEGGELAGLSDEDVRHIQSYIKTMISLEHAEMYPVIIDCDYC